MVSDPQTTDEIPRAVWSGSFKMFGVDVKCHNLSNGQRVINAESMRELLDAMGTGGTLDCGEIEEFAKWRNGQ